MEKESDLAALVEQCQEYFQGLGVTPGWVARWVALSEGDRALARVRLDSWLELYLDACLVLQREPVDEDVARGLAARWPSALLYYAKMQRSE